MRKSLLLVVMGLLLTVAGCAGTKKVVTVPQGLGDKEIEMKASSFDFDPDVINARQGDRLVLIIENVSGIEHNFTLMSPEGEVLFDKELPENKKVRVEVPLTEVGEYPFHCHKPLHSTFGMKGRVVVEP